MTSLSSRYISLEAVNKYDHQKVEELANLHNEVRDIKARVEYLQEIAMENSDLNKFLWRTADGKTLALHQIDNDHLENIMKHLLDTGRTISPQIKAEARDRGITIPGERKVLSSGIDDELDEVNLNDIPF